MFTAYTQTGWDRTGAGARRKPKSSHGVATGERGKQSGREGLKKEAAQLLGLKLLAGFLKWGQIRR